MSGSFLQDSPVHNCRRTYQSAIGLYAAVQHSPLGMRVIADGRREAVGRGVVDAHIDSGKSRYDSRSSSQRIHRKYRYTYLVCPSWRRCVSGLTPGAQSVRSTTRCSPTDCAPGYLGTIVFSSLLWVLTFSFPLGRSTPLMDTHHWR